jgi:hypothetical protein
LELDDSQMIISKISGDVSVARASSAHSLSYQRFKGKTARVTESGLGDDDDGEVK